MALGWIQDLGVEEELTPLKVSMRALTESNTHYGCLDSDSPLVDTMEVCCSRCMRVFVYVSVPVHDTHCA